MIFLFQLRREPPFLNQNWENVLNYLVSKDGSITHIVCNTSWSGEILYISDMQSVKHIYLQEESQESQEEILGKMCMNHEKQIHK